MKLSKTLVTSTSQKLDNSKTTNDGIRQETATLVREWLLDNTARDVFLNWLTDKSKAVKGETPVEKLERGQSVKNFQNVINATPFQRLYFGIEQGNALTEKVSVTKAQKDFVDSGKATQEQYDSRKYFAWISKIEKEQATLKSEMAKLKKKYKVTNKQMSATANTLD